MRTETGVNGVDSGVNRREAIAALGALGAVAAFAPLARAQHEQNTIRDMPKGVSGLSALGGWDSAKGEYVLPPLPYAFNALEPFIDAQTMEIHHDKHHAGYVKGANKALAELAKLRAGDGDGSLIKAYERDLAFNGAGHVNHCIFWQVMAPPSKGGGGKPSGDLAAAIDRDFGSFDAFAKQFQEAAGAVEGSGWAWLVHEPVSGRLMVLQSEKHQNLTIWGVQPLLGVDVWEHAYYLKYQNKRADYVKAFMNLINWGTVAALHAHM